MVVAAPGDYVLLLERTRPTGFWQSVTGSLLTSETAARAAQRELAEETGFDAEPFTLQSTARFAVAPLWRTRYAPGVVYNLEHHFACVLDRRRPPRLAPDEHTAYQWLPLELAFRRVSSWTNRTALRAFQQHVGGRQPL